MRILFPPKTLVHNRGFDGSGTHGRGVLRRWSDLSKQLSSPEIVLPDSVVICQRSFDCVKKAVWRQNGKWLGALVDRLRWFRAIYLYRL